MGLLKKIKKIIAESYSPIVVPAACGHTTHLKGEVEICGEKHHFKFRGGSDQTPPYCLDCMARAAIRCAWCGKPIVIGEPITLYTPIRKDFQIPDHAKVYQTDPLQLVGCLRLECADTGGDRAGFWEYPGQVRRVASPTEIAISTNSVVMAGDVSKPGAPVTVFPD